MKSLLIGLLAFTSAQAATYLNYMSPANPGDTLGAPARISFNTGVVGIGRFDYSVRVFVPGQPIPCVRVFSVTVPAMGAPQVSRDSGINMNCTITLKRAFFRGMRQNGLGLVDFEVSGLPSNSQIRVDSRIVDPTTIPASIDLYSTHFFTN